MKVEVTEPSKNVFTNDDGFPTLQLGDGNTQISTLEIPNTGVCGVSFTEKDGEVGAISSTDKTPEADEPNVIFRIITDNPVSIQVLIDRLREAQDSIRRFKEMPAVIK